MIPHQTIRVHLPARLLAGFGQRFDEVLPVNIVAVYVLPPIPTAHDMIHRPGIFNANFSRHGATLSEFFPLSIQYSSLTPFQKWGIYLSAVAPWPLIASQHPLCGVSLS